MRKIAKISVFIIIVTVMGLYLFSSREKIQLLRSIIPGYLILILVCELGAILINSYLQKLVIGSMGVDLKAQEWIGLTICNAMFNYFVPARGGNIARAMYLKKKYKLDYSRFASLLVGLYIITFGAASFLGAGLIISNSLLSGTHYPIIITVFISVAIPSLIVIILAAFGRQYDFNWIAWERLRKICVSFYDGLRLFLGNFRLVIYSGLLTIFFIAISAGELFCAFKAVQVDINYVHVLILACFIILSWVVALTPGNLGIRESLLIYGAHSFGVPIPEATVAAIVCRTMMMLTVFSLGIPMYAVLQRTLSQLAVTEKPSNSY